MIELDARLESVKAARDYVGKIAEQEDWPVDHADALVVASELATNAIMHTPCRLIRVGAYYDRDDSKCVVEVWDGDETLISFPGPDEDLPEPTLPDEHGRGFFLICAFASCLWSKYHSPLEGGGKT